MNECTLKSPHLNKSSTTGVTAVRLLPRVNASVSLEVGRSVELGPAHIAAVRLVACWDHSSCVKVLKKGRKRQRWGKRFFSNLT